MISYIQLFIHFADDIHEETRVNHSDLRFKNNFNDTRMLLGSHKFLSSTGCLLH